MDKDTEEREEEQILDFPVMLLTGHEGEVYSVEFSEDGRILASSGKDGKVLLFNAFGDCANFALLKGHKNAVLEVHFADNYLYSCSADWNCSLYDVLYQKQLRKFKGHTGIVNSCFPVRSAPGQLLVSGSDDGSVRVWDSRQRRWSNSIAHDFQVLAVTTDPEMKYIYTGSLDNVIRVYDVRNESDVFLELKGCRDSITSLDLNSDCSLLLSNSMDERLVIWDVQPFPLNTITTNSSTNNSTNSSSTGSNSSISGGSGSEEGRKRMELLGPTHGSEKNLIRSHWGRNSVVCSGSADHFVYVFDTFDRKLLFQLPGHLGTVNDVRLHPKLPIIASCSSDRTIYLGQL